MRTYLLKYEDGREEFINLDKVITVEWKPGDVSWDPNDYLTIRYETAWSVDPGHFCDVENYECHSAYTEKMLCYSKTSGEAKKILNEIREAMEEECNFKKSLLSKLDKLIEK